MEKKTNTKGNKATENNATEKNVTEKKLIPMVTGRVSFYGKLDNYKHNGKEFVLAIENPVFSGVTEEIVNDMYDTENKPNAEIAKMYVKILSGEIPETAYFRSKYDVENVWYNGNYMDVGDISNFSLNDAYIKMTLKKSYIGKICLLENGTPYNPFDD